ncbi:MAG: tetratricopeptide repeat protein [bacterium]|nr:tetratricopeptide repeat protein [bacterium]
MRNQKMFWITVSVLGLICLLQPVHGSVAIYYVQTGVYTTAKYLGMMQQELIKLGYTEQTVVSAGKMQKLWLGPVATYQEAKRIAEELRTSGYPSCFPVETKVDEKTLETLGISISLIPSLSLEGEEMSKSGIVIQPSIYREMKPRVNFSRTVSESQLWSDFSTLWKQDTASTYRAAEKLVELIIRYPKTEQAPLAKYYLGKIYSSLYYRMVKDGSTDRMMMERYLRSSAQVLEELEAEYAKVPILPSALFQLGLTKIALSRFGGNYIDKLEEAAEVFKKLVDRYPADSLAAPAQMHYCGMLFELALNHRVSWEVVRAELRKTEKTYPEAEPWVFARCALMDAESFFYEKDYETLIRLCEQLIKKYPTCKTEIALAESWVARGYLETGLHRTALELYQSLLSKYSNSEKDDPLIAKMISSSLYCTAWLKYQLGDALVAKETAQQVIQRYPNSKEATAAKALLTIPSLKVR